MRSALPKCHSALLKYRSAVVYRTAKSTISRLKMSFIELTAKSTISWLKTGLTVLNKERLAGAACASMDRWYAQGRLITHIVLR
jgi:hypothetical protein